jgi:hypothetical protein
MNFSNYLVKVCWAQCGMFFPEIATHCVDNIKIWYNECVNDILLTNIFFLVTAVATVILTIAVVMLLISMRRLVKKLQVLADIVTDEAKKVQSDIDEAREAVRGVAILHVLSALAKKLFGKK